MKKRPANSSKKKASPQKSMTNSLIRQSQRLLLERYGSSLLSNSSYQEARQAHIEARHDGLQQGIIHNGLNEQRNNSRENSQSSAFSFVHRLQDQPQHQREQEMKIEPQMEVIISQQAHKKEYEDKVDQQSDQYLPSFGLAQTQQIKGSDSKQRKSCKSKGKNKKSKVKAIQLTQSPQKKTNTKKIISNKHDYRQNMLLTPKPKRTSNQLSPNASSRSKSPNDKKTHISPSRSVLPMTERSSRYLSKKDYSAQKPKNQNKLGKSHKSIDLPKYIVSCNNEVKRKQKQLPSCRSKMPNCSVVSSHSSQKMLKQKSTSKLDPKKTSVSHKATTKQDIISSIIQSKLKKKS